MAGAAGHISVGKDDGTHAAWRSYGREELDFQYSPSRSAHAFADTVRHWEEKSVHARTALAPITRLDVRYGKRPRQTLDWFGVADRCSRKPVHVFMHGGFWQESSKDAASFLALSHIASGHQFVAIGYTLAPNISLKGIIGEIDEAYCFVQTNAPMLGGDPERIIVSGHSAGAYLAASLMSRATGRADRPSAAVLISGVYDLEPICQSYVNDQLGLSPQDATALSLATRLPPIDIPVRIVVGGDETTEFRRQSQHLFDAWRNRIADIELVILPGRDHFDILFDAGAAEPLVAETIGIEARERGARSR